MRLVHEEHRELGDEQTFLGAAATAGLDVVQFQTDWHNPQLAPQALLSHQQGGANHHIFGTPTLVFPNHQAIHLELNHIPASAQAVSLWQTILKVAQEQPIIRQIKRTTPV